EANTSNIEVTSKLQGENGQSDGRSGTQRIAVNVRETDPGEVKIGPGDSVRVNQKFHKIADNSVMIIGEVEHPGRYDLTPGDKMSDLLRRAGGLTQQAYPDGAIFSRENERRAEESRFRAQAQDLEVKLAAAMSQKEEPDENKIAAVQGLVTQLRGAEALGRITVESDPAMLAVQPELDILLEAGDRVYIPKRPLTVRVAGEVLSPASLQFRKDKDPRDYIMQAGGFTFDSDKDRTFVIYPDGSAQPLLVNNWNHAPAMIPPGSTIVVPRDPKPFDFIQTAKDVSQILSNLAITGIFIDDIRSGD
ncbi:MAG TPA: SLBB domain-containing protein, partial [Micavibrio sp.]